MAQRIRITDSNLRLAVASASSVTDTLRSIGIPRPSGTTVHRYKKRMESLNIDMGHFQRPVTKQGGVPRMPASERLVQRHTSWRQSSAVLRRCLLEIGRPEVCEICGLPPEWNGKPLRLEIDHINGVNTDDRAENLRFLDPNCHGQIPVIQPHKIPIRLCALCNAELYKHAVGNHCGQCLRKNHNFTKIKWPPDDELLQRVQDLSKTMVAKELGVTEGAVRKRMKKCSSSLQARQ